MIPIERCPLAIVILNVRTPRLERPGGKPRQSVFRELSPWSEFDSAADSLGWVQEEALADGLQDTFCWDQRRLELLGY